MMEKEKYITLEIITPAGTLASVSCESVLLSLSDNQKGHGKGLYGIRRGHADAILLLTDGITRAQLDGREILLSHTGKGFASVADDLVSVVVDKARLCDGKA